MTYVAIKKETLDKVTTYLGKRPYIEVFRMFKDLQDGIKPIGESISAVTQEQEKNQASSEENGQTDPK